MIQLPDVFGRRPWLSEDPKRRAAAAAEGVQPELLDQLPELARHDPAAEVRLAALARLDDFALWCERLATDPDQRVCGVAHDKVIKHLLQAATAPAAAFNWLAGQDDQDLFTLVAHKAADPRLRAAAIGRCTRQGALATCVLHDDSPDNRELALQRIEQPSTLKRLHKMLHGSDKVWFAKVECRIDALTGGQRHTRRRLTQLNREAEALLRGTAGGDLAAEFGRLRAAFAASGAAPSEPLAQRLEVSLRIIEGAVRRGVQLAPVPAPEPAAETATDTLPPAAVPDHPSPALAGLQKRLAALRRAAQAGKHNPTALAVWQRDWHQQWGSLAAPGLADRHCAEVVHSWLGEIDRFAQQPPAGAETVSAASLAELLDRLRQALDEGLLAGAYQTAQNILALPARRRASRQPEIQAALHRLDELRRWQRWANHRRRRDLIRQLLSFDRDDVHPDALAGTLRQTFAEWQTLEQHDLAAGLPGGGRLWPRLQQAAGRLRRRIEPFTARRERLHETFTEALQRAIAAADEWLASEASDPAAGRRLRRDLAAGLRQLDLVQGKARRELANGAHRRLKAIAGRLQQAAAAADARKQELIVAVRALTPGGAAAHLKQQVRELQRRWKDAGHAGTRREPALWREFREAIDALFAGADAERQARDAASRERQQRAEDLCSAWEALAALGPEAGSGDKRAATLAAAWGALGAVPEALQRRWRQAENTLRQQHEKAQQARQKEALRTICSAAAALSAERQQWMSAVNGAGDAAAPPAGLDPQWAELDPATLQKRLAEQAAAARRVCVEFEYLLHLPSPAADRTLRMQHQVEMLNRQLAGHGLPPRQTQIEELNRRWRDAAPMSEADYDALAARIAAVHRQIIDS